MRRNEVLRKNKNTAHDKNEQQDDLTRAIHCQLVHRMSIMVAVILLNTSKASTCICLYLFIRFTLPYSVLIVISVSYVTDWSSIFCFAVYIDNELTLSYGKVCLVNLRLYI